MNQLTLDFPVVETPKPIMKRYDFDRYDSPHWFTTHLPNLSTRTTLSRVD
jgi:hypothetical protein